MGSRFLIVFVAICLLAGFAPMASAQKDVDVFNWGVPYFVATGTLGSGHFSLGPGYDGKSLIPFAGCGSVLARPAKGAAGIDAVGLIDNTNVVEITFDEFRTPAANMPRVIDGVGANLTIDGSEDHEGKPTHPKAFARVAAWSTAHIEVDGFNFTDDGRTAKVFWASFFVTNQGFRDNASKAILTKSNAAYDPVKSKDPILGVDDWEMHMRLEAPGSKVATPVSYSSAGDSPAGTGIITYQEDHQAEFFFISQAPGAKANLTFRVNTRAPNTGPATTALKFVVIAPGGQMLYNATLSPNVPATTDQRSVAIPLNQFGAYKVQVSGKAVMASYTVTGRVQQPPKLDFNFWWEDVAFERPALEEISDCKDNLLNGLTQAVISGVGRTEPPRFNMEIVAVGIGASVLAVLFLVKLVSDAVITSKFKAIFKGKA